MKISLRFSAANDSPNSETEEDDPLERIVILFYFILFIFLKNKNNF